MTCTRCRPNPLSEVFMTRREALVTFAAVPALAAAAAPPAAPAAAAPRALKPLPFNAAKLKGLSEKLLVSHHENNYGGALKNLLKVEDELSRVTKDTPGFVLFGL